MPVSDATLSTSPTNPQLHSGTGWPSASNPSIGMCTWPSSPAMPAAPRTTWPRLDHAAAETGADDRRHRRPARGVVAEVGVVGVQRGGVAVVVVDDGQAEAASSAPRKSKPRHSGWAKLVDPFDEITPSATGRAGRVETDGARRWRGATPVISKAVSNAVGQRIERRARCPR